MTRRDRTTGLPLARRGRRAAARAGEARGLLAQRTVRFGIIALALAALLAVAGLLIYNWYDQSVGRPGKVVLQVGDETFTLSYYAARLPQFVEDSPTTSGLLATRTLLRRLEEEGIVIAAATAQGVTLDDEAVREAIALRLGVPNDSGRGGFFDQRYREALRESGLSESHYRQRAKAEAADQQLRQAIRDEIGERGAIVHLRVVTVATLEEAEAVRARIEAGEDMGTIAQAESLHQGSRQEDGRLVSPPELFAAALAEALAGAAEGDLLAPVEAENLENVWVVRLERREAEGEYSADNRATLTSRRVEEALAAARASVTIERNLSTDDANWAVEQAR